MDLYRFVACNLDQTCIQSPNDRLDVYARASARRTGHNLDSSEKSGVGGASQTDASTHSPAVLANVAYRF